MSAHTLTVHARIRMQQRGITPEALAMLLAIGQTGPAPGGRELIFIDRAERRRLRIEGALRVRGRDRFSRLYAVTDDHGVVITVGHRYRNASRRARLECLR